jgi:thiamine biosynthesis lipoprotein
MVLSQTADLCFDEIRAAPPSRAGTSFYETSGMALGTQCRMLFSCDSRGAAEVFRADAATWLMDYEARYSRFVDSSLINKINAAAGSHAVEIDDELVSIFKLCDWFHWSSSGVFDPTMLPLTKLWDYKAEVPRPPSEAAIKAALERVAWSRVRRDDHRVMLPEPGMALEIGGIGKEYAVDRVCAMAQESGIRNYMIDFGHDIRVAGSPPEGGDWRIGLEDPRTPGRCGFGVGLSGMAIASSGNYARGFDWEGRRYGHILDPRTGYPVDNGSLVVSVVASTCTEAGILSTVAFVLGPSEFIRFLGTHQQAEGCMITQNGTIRTPGFARYELRQRNADRKVGKDEKQA